MIDFSDLYYCHENSYIYLLFIIFLLIICLVI